MKIAVFIKSTTFHAGYGGFETQNKVLCEGLTYRGHTIHVMSPQRELGIKTTEENNVHYHFIPSRPKMLFSGSDKNSWENRSVEYFKTLNAIEKFDVIISQSTGGIGLIKNKGKIKVKILGISHGTIGGEVKTVLMNAHSPKNLVGAIPSLGYGAVNLMSRQRTYARGVDKLVAVSNYVKKALLTETRVSQNKIEVIQNGIDNQNFPNEARQSEDPGLFFSASQGNSHTHTKTHGLPAENKLLSKKGDTPNKAKDKVEILYLGRIEPSKGIQELLFAVKEVKEARLNVVGDGPILEDMKLLARNLKISNRVIFYGKLPYEKALEMYNCSQIFVLPSKRVEGLPMVLVEALFAKLAIIASDIGGNSDVVEDGYNGFLVQSGNIKELAYKLKLLCEDTELAKEMGKNGIIKGETMFTLNIMLNKYEMILRKLTS